MSKEIVELNENISGSPLYSEDLKPIPKSGRTWGTWHLVALWVGMAVCIPTYLLASYMIRSGLNWYEALIIIGIANLVITIPMVLNGHAGFKYGIPFPVVGRAAFGTNGVHVASVMRGIVACGWFGVQTWIGGTAIDAIYHAIAGTDSSGALTASKFICFGIFWLINIYFVWKGTESIKWLETWSAPILILMGILLIVWGAVQAGGFMRVLNHSKELSKQSAQLVDKEGVLFLDVVPMAVGDESNKKYVEFKVTNNSGRGSNQVIWHSCASSPLPLQDFASVPEARDESIVFDVQFRKKTGAGDADYVYSNTVRATFANTGSGGGVASKIWKYIIWFTAMVGFWATMSISIADVTRFAKTQKAQIAGQFIGLPGTMIFYSFVGIFVTCAAALNFNNVLIPEDAPWDPVALLARFSSPVVVVVSQLFMLIATLSTNIAANIIAPAYAFSNLFPRKISFRVGGVISGVIGILICPWWLMDDISYYLVLISGLLGPVLGVLICDYFLVRKKTLDLPGLYKVKGVYAYSGGFNIPAFLALFIGVGVAVIGMFVPALSFLYSLSWFSGFISAFVMYYLLMPKTKFTSSKTA